VSRLPAIASTLLGLALLAGLGWLAWSWYDSRLPGSYSAMDYATPDYGGGPRVSHHSAVPVDELGGPAGRAPDFRRTITARQADVRLSSGKVVHALTFDGQVPGPELRVRQGDLVEVSLVNEDIPEGVSIHWHGIDVPNREDGVAGVTQNAVRPGERYTYRFRAEQVGTFWYHSHENAADEVRRGLYGALVIQPQDRPPGTLDLTAVVHSFADAVVIGSSDGTERRTVRPGTPVRLRLVNSDSSAQSFALTGTQFSVVAIDGTDLSGPTPVRDRSIQLGAGARYDLAFTMPADPVRLEVAGTNAAILFEPPGQTGDESRAELGPTFDPAGYGSAAARPFTASTRFDRNFEVDIGRKLGFLDGKPGSHWSVNGKLYPHTPMYMVSVGDLVKMTIENDSGATHPMHLHGHHFLVLSRNGEPLTGSPWWVDTLNVRQHETYEVGFRASNPGIWMFHCHNLPHARDGLTMHVMYGGVTTPYRVGDAVHNHPE
jgi:FtsP/CotA-like multicopper oxidase with cupredoxin domain